MCWPSYGAGSAVSLLPRSICVLGIVSIPWAHRPDWAIELVPVPTPKAG
jgi:hypothetical protein